MVKCRSRRGGRWRANALTRARTIQHDPPAALVPVGVCFWPARLLLLGAALRLSSRLSSLPCSTLLFFSAPCCSSSLLHVAPLLCSMLLLFSCLPLLFCSVPLFSSLRRSILPLFSLFSLLSANRFSLLLFSFLSAPFLLFSLSSHSKESALLPSAHTQIDHYQNLSPPNRSNPPCGSYSPCNKHGLSSTKSVNALITFAFPGFFHAADKDYHPT